MNYRQKYFQELKKELTQFIFLCGPKDGSILISKATKSKIDEYIRLACLSIVFGYKTVFMKIVAHTEKYFDLFMTGLETVSKNFLKIDEWTKEFIDNIEYPEVQNLMRDFWTEQKANIEPDDFNIRQLLKQ